MTLAPVRRIQDKDTITALASVVVDNGRRGNPRKGCDCVQCFGYCMVDGDEAVRANWRTDKKQGETLASTESIH